MSFDTATKITKHLNDFRVRFKDLLDENSLTIREFSGKAEIKESRLYAFLKPPGSPSLKNAWKIAQYFKTTLDYLFGFCPDFRPKEYVIADTVSNRIKIAFDESHLSRYKISRETGIPQSELSKWYNGQREPALVSLLTLAEILNCSLDFLAGRKE